MNAGLQFWICGMLTLILAGQHVDRGEKTFALWLHVLGIALFLLGIVASIFS